MKFLVVVSLLFIGGCVTISPSETRRNDMLEPVVKLSMENGSGSGIVVFSDDTTTVIITANHVIADEDVIKVSFSGDDKKYPATVLKADSVTDLAVLQVNRGNSNIVRFSTNEKIPSMVECFAVGNGASLSVQLTQGFIITTSKIYIMCTALITTGTSGGGLFIKEDGHYYLIGVITATASQEMFAYNMQGRVVAVMDLPINHIGLSINIKTILDYLK